MKSGGPQKRILESTKKSHVLSPPSKFRIAKESRDENVGVLQGKYNEDLNLRKPNSTKMLTDLGHLMEISENLEILEKGWTV